MNAARLLVKEAKNASIKGGSTANRVRSSADARATRTNSGFVKPNKSIASANNSSSQSSTSSFQLSTSGSASSSRSYRSSVAQPSRQLVIARREALSRRGKSADNTKDITRVELERKKVQSAPSYDDKKMPNIVVQNVSKKL